MSRGDKLGKEGVGEPLLSLNFAWRRLAQFSKAHLPTFASFLLRPHPTNHRALRRHQFRAALSASRAVSAGPAGPNNPFLFFASTPTRTSLKPGELTRRNDDTLPLLHSNSTTAPMQALPPRPSSRIRLPFLTNIAAAGDAHESLRLESNYKHYAQLSQRAFLQDVAQQCGVDSIELVSARDLGVRIVAASRAANALAVAAVSSLLGLDFAQAQARPGLLLVPLSHADKLRVELTRIHSGNGNVQIKEGSHIAPVESFPVLIVAAPHLPAVEADAWVAQAVRRLQATLCVAAEAKYPSYQQHSPQQQQQQLISPWGHVIEEEQQQELSNIVGIQQQQQQQQASTMSGGGFGGGGSSALPAWNESQATIPSPSSGSSPHLFWQSHSSSPPVPFPPPLTPTALLQVLKEYFGLVPTEPESSGRDFFQKWGLLVHGTPDLCANVRESTAAISVHEDLLLHAAAAVTDSTIDANSEPPAAAAAEEYLQVARSDWGFGGGRLEMEAAARCYGVRLAVFDAEEQRMLEFHPLPLPLLLFSPPGGGGVSPLQREVALLHCRGLCWLLLREEDVAAAAEGEEMETEVVLMGEREREMDDLSISSRSTVSEGMLDG